MLFKNENIEHVGFPYDNTPSGTAASIEKAI